MDGQRVMVPKGPRATAARTDGWIARQGQPPLPDWLEIRDHQLDAVDQLDKGFADGARVMFLDAPTGTGKTAIAELLRRKLDVARGLYVCTTKSLQEQVAHDFGYARVLKGRANYAPTKVGIREQEGWGSDALRITCGDCDRGPADLPMDEQTCSYCYAVDECPYQIARSEAARAPVGVLNTSYLLTALNGAGQRQSPFGGRELVVADECDLIEDELLGYVEFRLGTTMAGTLGVEVPKKGSHMTTIRAWLEAEVVPAAREARKRITANGLEARRNRNRLEQLIQDAQRVVDREDGWVRDGDEEDSDRRGFKGNALVLKPVSIEDVGERYLWRHGERWLCMSGTVVSAETMADGLGLTTAGIEWGVVQMPMRFPVENRRVVFAPVVSMTKKQQEVEGTVAKMLTAVQRVVERHEGENVLVHTHTYKLAREVSQHLRREMPGVQVVTYQDGRERDTSLAMFKAMARQGGGVMVAPSMDRGIDLPGDLCRVQVVVKMPMASLGSRQVSERLRTPGGNDWYLANTVRTIQQMTGRAVRGMDDWAVCYILDAAFSKVLGDGKKRGMWPQWWLDALELGRVREYI